MRDELSLSARSMPKTQPFDDFADEYDQWFEEHAAAYESELKAVRTALGDPGRCVEIGLGTGRFAAPLGIRLGVEPSQAAAKLAEERGIEVLEGVAESLPLDDAAFDSALMVTAICFVDDAELALREMHRVLRPGGRAVVGFIDGDSSLGCEYRQRAVQSRFYAAATFFSAAEVQKLLTLAGFTRIECWQTLFRPLGEVSREEEVRPGCGDGSFVVMRALKRKRG